MIEVSGAGDEVGFVVRQELVDCGSAVVIDNIKGCFVCDRWYRRYSEMFHCVMLWFGRDSWLHNAHGYDSGSRMAVGCRVDKGKSIPH